MGSETVSQPIFIIGLFFFSTIFTYVSHWLVGLLWLGIKKLFITSRRDMVLYLHTKRHRLPTPDHNEPLFICMNNPCDTLFINAQALGGPAESEPLSGNGTVRRDK